ncbi:PD-(D/E)XK nuclease family protein, partial [Sulfurimonas sp.]
MKQKIIDTINDHELQAIKKFIYNDEIQDTLAHINDNVMDFNILEITGMGHYEIRHSNILGWLFDDSEHNLEYKILENFLKKVIEANKYTDDTKEKDILDKLQSYIYLAEKKKDITIYREKDNIDLLIVDEANRVVITIENKIFSKERTSGETDDGQLSKYENIIKEKFKNDYEKYFIFLTLNLDEPIKGKEYWMQASYQMIADVIENILSVKQELSVKTRLVLDSYVDLLKRRGIVASKELEELTNKIWSNPDYKKALEILYQYKPDMQLIISK